MGVGKCTWRPGGRREAGTAILSPSCHLIHMLGGKKLFVKQNSGFWGGHWRCKGGSELYFGRAFPSPTFPSTKWLHFFFLFLFRCIVCLCCLCVFFSVAALIISKTKEIFVLQISKSVHKHWLSVWLLGRKSLCMKTEKFSPPKSYIGDQGGTWKVPGIFVCSFLFRNLKSQRRKIVTLEEKKMLL